MKPILVLGVLVTTTALVGYAVSVNAIVRRRRLTASILGFLGVGLVADLLGTTCMVLGAEGSPYTPHGLLGFAAAGLMVVTVLRAFAERSRVGEGAVGEGFRRLLVASFALWVVAYGTGVGVGISRRLAPPAAAGTAAGAESR
jgi:hypothetical protein